MWSVPQENLCFKGNLAQLLYLYKNWDTAHLNMKTQNKREGLSGRVKGYNAIEPWKGKSCSLLFYWIFNQSWPRFPLSVFIGPLPIFEPSLSTDEYSLKGRWVYRLTGVVEPVFSKHDKYEWGEVMKILKKIEWVYTTWRVQSCTFKTRNPTETPINSLL